MSDEDNKIYTVKIKIPSIPKKASWENRQIYIYILRHRAIPFFNKNRIKSTVDDEKGYIYWTVKDKLSYIQKLIGKIASYKTVLHTVLEQNKVKAGISRKNTEDVKKLYKQAFEEITFEVVE